MNLMVNYVEEALKLLNLAKSNSTIGSYQEIANTQLKIANAYIELAKIESQERIAENTNEIFDRKQFS